MKTGMKYLSLTLIIALFIFAPLFLVAAEETNQGLLPTEHGVENSCPQGSSNCGNYSLDDFIRLGINISDWILGIVGSLALLAFIAGGAMLLFSGGNSEWVSRGKSTLIGAVIGLVIVFSSFMIINFIMGSLDYNQESFGQWQKIPDGIDYRYW